MSETKKPAAQSGQSESEPKTGTVEVAGSDEQQASSQEAIPIYKNRLEQARGIVQRNAMWSFAGGVIPIPVVDVLAVGGVQVKMLNELSKLYDVPFSEHKVINIVSVLLGSLTPKGLAASSIGYWLRAVPIFGPTLGILTMPTFASAATWAVGRVFIPHFEAGGTLLSFDAEKMREHFKQEFTKALAETKA